MNNENYGVEAAPEKSSPADPQQDQSGDDANTALVPSSLFGADCKVGDTYTVRVVAKYEDEVEVEPVKDGEKQPNAPEASPDDELASMAASAPQ